MCQLLPGCVILTRAVCTSSWNSERSHSRRNDRVEQELQGRARSTAENWSCPWQQGILRLAEKCLLLLSGKSYLWETPSCVCCFAVYLFIYFSWGRPYYEFCRRISQVTESLTRNELGHGSGLKTEQHVSQRLGAGSLKNSTLLPGFCLTHWQRVVFGSEYTAHDLFALKLLDIQMAWLWKISVLPSMGSRCQWESWKGLSGALQKNEVPGWEMRPYPIGAVGPLHKVLQALEEC